MTAFYIKLEFSGKIYLDIKFPSSSAQSHCDSCVVSCHCVITQAGHRGSVRCDVMDMQHSEAVETDEELVFIDRLAVSV